jgi:protoporphyrinogen oxidase
MTLPNPLVKQIAPELPAAYVEVLDRVRYQWATCLVLALDRPLTEYYWLSIADPLPFVACVEHTNFMPKERYDNNHIVYFSNYTSTGHEVLQMDAEQVIDYYLEGIKKLNPKFDKSWIRQSWFFKDPGGQPVITTNYSRSIPDMHTGIKGLYLANTTQVYPEDRGQNYSLLLGEKVANLMHQEGGEYIQASGM